MKPGTYTCQVNVFDPTTQKFVIWRDAHDHRSVNRRGKIKTGGTALLRRTLQPAGSRHFNCIS